MTLNENAAEKTQEQGSESADKSLDETWFASGDRTPPSSRPPPSSTRSQRLSSMPPPPPIGDLVADDWFR